MKSTHSDRLERWLGIEQVKSLSDSMRGWYGPPIAVHGVPGAVWATGDGDFVGDADCGFEVSARERFERVRKRLIEREKARFALLARRRKQGGSFGSYSALITAATGGKKRDLTFMKAEAAGLAVGVYTDMWTVGSMPAAGSAGAAAPGGTAHASTDTGALFFDNPSTANSYHFVRGDIQATQARTLLLYDRLFAVAKTMNSTATEAVTGVPTRYQNTVAGSADSAEGNFLFIAATTVLPATAHNWTVCQYTDQSGNAGANLPSVTGISSCAVNRLDMPVGQWFAPLASGDNGIQRLTQMQCSALVASGAINFVMGHPIAWMPCPIANLVCTTDGLSTAFNLTQIFDNACLSFLCMQNTATATTVTGQICIVSE
jgi:hypothetical protein